MPSGTVIITGANSGLGWECARTILKANKGWTVVMACRNLLRGEEARQRLIKETGSERVVLLPLNLASFKSIRQFVAAFISQSLPPLHGLINNAGLQVMKGLEYTEDGIELTFGTNHLGHFLLTNLLLEHLQEPARIIVVSSGTHDPSTIEGRFNKPVYLGARGLAYPSGIKEMSGMQRYATSKLCNLLFAYELNKRLGEKNITVNAFDPAAVPATNLLGSIKNPFIRWSLRTSTRLFRYFGVLISTPSRSGAAMARLLLDEKLEGISGRYFQIMEEKKTSAASYDSRLAAELWEESWLLIWRFGDLKIW